MVQYRISRTRSAPLENLLLDRAPLSEQHLAFIRDRLGPTLTLAPDTALFDRPGVHGPLIVAAGWAASAWELASGQRQVTDLFLPGDIISPPRDVHDPLRAVALTPLAVMEASALAASLSASSDLQVRLLAEAWSEEARAAQDRHTRHLVRLGKLSTYERTADLFLDLYDRLLRAGLAERGAMSMPLTQELLAEHLGVSKVHMNRTLQQMRRDQLVTSVRGQLFAVDPDRLRLATPLGDPPAELSHRNTMEDRDASLLLPPVDPRGTQRGY